MSKLTRFFRAQLQPLLAAQLYGADERNFPAEDFLFESTSFDGVGEEENKLLLRHFLPEKALLEPCSISGLLTEFKEFVKTELTANGLAQLENELKCASRYNPPAIVAQFQRGRILHTCGAIIDCRNRLILNMSGILKNSDLPGNPLKRGRLSAPRMCEGTVACLTGASHHNVFHWYMDILPKLELIEASGVKIDKYFVPTKHRHQRESLARLGIDAERIVTASDEKHIECDNVIAVSFAGGVLNTFRVEAVRKLLGNQNERLFLQTPKRLYISRRKARVRRIVNEQAVERTLSRFGFTKIFLEDLPITKQIELFEAAEMIVAPHGAGLTNTCFSRPGTKVLELNTPVRISSLFSRIAGVCGLEYHLHIAKPRGVKHFGPETALGDSDLLVDEVSLERTVRSILEESRVGLYRCSDLLETASTRLAS